MPTGAEHSRIEGLPFILGAHAFWGLMPLYLVLVKEVPPIEFVAWRILFTLPLCLAILAIRKQGAEIFRALSDRRTILALLASSAMIGINWVLYVVAIQTDHVYAASLGYYILPLTMMLLGMLVLGERMSTLQWGAVALAAVGVALLAAGALAAPTKSDLQQRDIVLVTDVTLRAALNALLADQSWTAKAPALLVFCGNNRRQRRLHELRGRPFANDHLDAFFNAAVDAGIALASYVTAAETMGLGCCPISALRNDAEEVSRLLGLPDHVFPLAGLAVGWPVREAVVTPRLPLAVTLHEDRYGEEGLDTAIADYDRQRPYDAQRYVEDFGEDPDYGWSEDKARQYAKPERAGFGAFVRRKGFCLD